VLILHVLSKVRVIYVVSSKMLRDVTVMAGPVDAYENKRGREMWSCRGWEHEILSSVLCCESISVDVEFCEAGKICVFCGVVLVGLDPFFLQWSFKFRMEIADCGASKGAFLRFNLISIRNLGYSECFAK
jgi:hypothetical protein